MFPGIELIIEQCSADVAPQTMAAIVKVESGGNPWAINDNTAKSNPKPKSRAEAIKTARHLIAQGHNLDLGVSQINYGNLHKLGLTIDEVFDPCTNIRAGATILKKFYVVAASKYGPGQTALMHALSGYNTGSLYAGSRYVAKIVAAATTTSYKQVASIDPRWQVEISRGQRTKQIIVLRDGPQPAQSSVE